ncbi:lysophospholipase L1-like esterase [Paenibacillus cellulosilyticus]|uniref:Lysophospholipase L1-like esterase n=1 Tax=Paenibacillus cellulosilyticus TaxID=375489 RepID=A0A2V2YX62_9BACL|nr:GDSL-type esterase/lipase family protein [Paenibacillus cellulosilyticus]PWW05480.1 lysophospholipase L1-like esterase [Paenibacillus cellulosilyticus]QKS45479.1 GDSL family lipase [Paenibacillus cellulosilyticus]
MNRGNGLWRLIGITSLITTIVFICGFGFAMNDILNPRQAPSLGDLGEPEQSYVKDDVIHVTALGDSLTKGTGDSTGEGYVKQTIKLMEGKYDKPVKLLNNLAINGMRADQLVEKLKSDKGYRLAVSEADIILLTIGGNDLFRFARGGNAASKQDAAADNTAENEASSSQTDDDIEDQISLEEVKTNLAEGVGLLRQTLELLNSINPDARIVYIGLYNPFYDVAELRDGSLQVQDWNRAAYDVIHRYPNMLLVPTSDLFEKNLTRYLASDHFHPNHDGYAAIAQRIVQAID